jgi:hypothetical protein
MAESPRIEELKRRVQVDPASIAFAALAEEYRRAGRFEEAIATCEAGLQRHPAYLSAHVTLGRALLELGRFDEAKQELEHVRRVAPENLAAIRGLAEIHHRRGELPEALEQYKSALHVAKHDTEIEEAVDQISKQVAPVEVGEAAAAAIAVPEPARPRLALVTWPPPSVQPEPGAEAATVALPEEPVHAPIPVTPQQSKMAPADPAVLAPVKAVPAAPAAEPTLNALEDLLEAILREKQELASQSAVASR